MIFNDSFKSIHSIQETYPDVKYLYDGLIEVIDRVTRELSIVHSDMAKSIKVYNILNSVFKPTDRALNIITNVILDYVKNDSIYLHRIKLAFYNPNYFFNLYMGFSLSVEFDSFVLKNLNMVKKVLEEYMSTAYSD